MCWLGVQSMRDIVGKCLIKDASKRPSAAQLLEHKFFKVCSYAYVWVPSICLVFACLRLLQATRRSLHLCISATTGSHQLSITESYFMPVAVCCKVALRFSAACPEQDSILADSQSHGNVWMCMILASFKLQPCLTYNISSFTWRF